jgi:ribonuclease BN (tRNA processing enzyme)
MQLQHYLALEHLDAAVISHYHWDHIADIGCLQYASRVLMDLGKRKQPLHIYGHREDPQFERLAYLTYSLAHGYDTSGILQIGDLNFSFSPNVHPDPCFSMRIEKNKKILVYIADTEWTDDLVAIAKNADLLLCESSLYDEYIGRIPGHLTAGEAGAVAAAAGVKHLVLNHLPHFGDHNLLVKQAAKKFGGPVELATTGKSWEI